MMFDYAPVKPLTFLGLTGNFWTLHMYTLEGTWIAMGIILVLALIGRRYLKRDHDLVAVSFEKAILFFFNLGRDSFKPFNYNYFAFVTTIFFFTFSCCLVGVLPYVHEATQDLNTAFALAITSFLYVQYQKIRVHGAFGFLKEFAEPSILLAPIHIVGELSKIASMSFRLFGNILGASIIISMIIELLASQKKPFFLFLIITLFLMSVVSFNRFKSHALYKIANICLFIVVIIADVQLFGIVDGIIQSFVLSMLTTTYLAIGTSEESADEQHLPETHKNTKEAL